MDKQRYLAALIAATAACFALFLLVNRLRPFLADAQTTIASSTVLGISSTMNPNAPTDRSPEIYQGSFLYSSTSAMLAALGVTVYPQDKVYAFPDPALGIGSTIQIYRAQPVTILDGAVSTSVRTWGTTVGAVLNEQNIEVGNQDTVVPSLDMPITLGSQPVAITIVRVALTQLTVTSDIDYTINYQNDPTLLQGTTKISQTGVEGTLRNVYQVRRENGVEVSRTLLSSVVEQSAVNEIVLKGTKPKVAYLTSGEYVAYFNEAVDTYSVPAASLQKLMMCESGGNVNSVGGSGYYGLVQFSQSTWSRTAYASRSIYDPEAQILAAASLWSHRSSDWPACTRTLGI
jgi:hypothetical protein